MRLLVQRVSQASVKIDGKVHGNIKRGFLILAGFKVSDDVENEDLSVYDGALFGSPIHAFRATRGIKGAVKKAGKKGLKAKIVASFDTYQAPGHKGKAASQIEDERLLRN